MPPFTESFGLIDKLTAFWQSSERRNLTTALLLGFAAGLPYVLVTNVLSLRLSQGKVDIAIIGFFAWIALLPTLKFIWAPMLERFCVPGFSDALGRRLGWILTALLGIFLALFAMGFVRAEENLLLTAILGTSLAFWGSTLEIAADGWRIETAPHEAEQGPVAAAYIWGYRGAMIVANGGAALIAEGAGWGAAYIAMAGLALAPLPFLIWGKKMQGMMRGFASSLFLVTLILAATTALLYGAASLGAQTGINAKTNITPYVLGFCLVPFVLMALILPKITRLKENAAIFAAPNIGPYIALFWRYGYGILGLLAFTALYRAGDTFTTTLMMPMWDARGYSLTEIATASGAAALPASLLGTALGGWAAARFSSGISLGAGALIAASGNAIYAVLWLLDPSPALLYFAASLDHFGNGFAAAVFVVFLSMLVSPRFPAAQYALLSGFAFLLPRLGAGLSGNVQKALGYDGFFLLSGGLTLSAILLLPWALRAKEMSHE